MNRDHKYFNGLHFEEPTKKKIETSYSGSHYNYRLDRSVWIEADFIAETDKDARERPFDWIYSLHGYYHTNTCLAMFFPKTKIFKTLQGVMVPEKPDFSIPNHEVKITWIPDLHNESNNWTTGNN
jgi:hypothetical protein